MRGARATTKCAPSSCYLVPLELASEPVSCGDATTKGSGVIQINDDVQIYHERAGGGLFVILIPGVGCTID